MTRALIISLCLPALGICLAGCAVKPQNAGAEILDRLKPLAGKWGVEELNRAGQSGDPEGLRASWVTVAGDTLKFVEVGRNGSTNLDEFVLQVDPTKNSNELDFVYKTGVHTGQTRRGIYSLESDLLKLCLAEIGAERPTDFAGKQDPPWLLIVLRRKP